jgi:hypothetical protein
MGEDVRMDRVLGRVENVSTVVPFHREDLNRCRLGCTGTNLCARCRQEIRIEALAWLRELSDDVFGERDGSDDVVIIPSAGSLAPGAQRFR